MDFGIGFLTNNIMLPILDFFYGIVPSYGLAIVALTLVIRFALYPLTSGQIRSMRRMKVAQPAMQKKVKEVQERYKDDPAKLQAEMGQVYKEFGNPLSGCLPLVVQMPILFALFATLRGSPFADVSYPINVQVLPQLKLEQVQPQIYSSKPSNIYVNDGEHFPVAAVIPSGTKLGVGETVDVQFQTPDGRSLQQLVDEYGSDDADVTPYYEITKGQTLVDINENGQIEALAPGDATIQVKLPGLAANNGFLFVQALGRVGVMGEEGDIRWDILGMVIFFGLSLYVNQLLTGQQKSSGDNPQQETITKLTPILFSGMFLFFPLPAGVLMYMVIANVFQTAQSFILSREPLPENLQAIVDAQEAAEKRGEGRESIAFEPGAKKTVTVKATEVKDGAKANPKASSKKRANGTSSGKSRGAKGKKPGSEKKKVTKS
ncbi:MAG: membrane protein insertase YidC [Cyanobacteria bacterium J06632_22]